MAEKLFIPSEPEDENRASKARGVPPGAPAQQSSGQPAQISHLDSTKIDKDVRPLKDDIIDPQLEKDIINKDRSLAVMLRLKEPDCNVELVARFTSEYMQIIEKANAVHVLPERLCARLEAAALKFASLSDRYKEVILRRLDRILADMTNKGDENELNGYSRIITRLYRVEGTLLDSKGKFKLSSRTVSRLQSAADLSRQMEEKIIHIATKKDYVLNDLDSAAGAAEEESNGYTFNVFDRDQEKILTQLKEGCARLLADIEDVIRGDEERKTTLDLTSVKTKLLEKKRELTFLVRQFIRKIKEQKLRDKMKAEAIVLAYLLKHPSSLTFKRLEDIRNEINKIKWTTFFH